MEIFQTMPGIFIGFLTEEKEVNFQMSDFSNGVI